VFEFARIAAVALLAALAQAQQGTQSSRSQQPPRFRGGTNLVRVDAFATKNDVPVQDLKADDFEILEDGAPQTINTFEHIAIEPSHQREQVDPSSVAQALQLAGDPHHRVFVIYLDTGHVDAIASGAIKEPLIDLMNRVMSDDDLVGIMTPEMDPQQITFARKTDVIERGLRENWAWGRRESVLLDEREKLYDMCFPPIAQVDESSPSDLVKTMMARRRERMALNSLRDLIYHIEAIRDGRTAVIAVSDGWILYGPDHSMLNPRKIPIIGTNADPLPGTPPPVGVGAGGTLRSRPENTSETPDQTECDKDRFELANLDDAIFFRSLVGEANRANVTFYTIDPRGLAASDAFALPSAPKPLGAPPDSTPLINQDLASLRTRHNALATLANDTNGIFLIDSNELGKQLRRIADDLTSYYLIGYYSTNPKLDGRYRTIKVRSKRPGVEVRARQGYRAASAAEVNAARAAADLAIPEEKAAIVRALGTLETDARAQANGRAIARGRGEPALFHRGPSTGNQLQPASARIFPRSDRVRVELEVASESPPWVGALLDRNGAKTAIPITVGSRIDTGSGQRWLTADVTLAPLGAGDYVIELASVAGNEQKRTLVAIRVTQ
jgi:VWFA-related protein